MSFSATAVRQRVLARLGGVSMYRLVLVALGALAALALVVSAVGVAELPGPVALLSSLAVLVVVVSAADAVIQRMLRLPWRAESSQLTALILLFALEPAADPASLVGTAVAGLVAAVSKYLLAWRGRHVLNPAAFGVAVASALATLGPWPALGVPATWWVGTPTMLPAVVLLGLAVLWRTEKVRIIAVYVLLAAASAVIGAAIAPEPAGAGVDVGAVLSGVVLHTPVLFVGAFMLSEPLTLPPRRWQQFWVAALVGTVVGAGAAGGGVPGPEGAVLLGNLLSFAFTLRGAARLTLVGRRPATPTVQELTFRVRGSLSFLAGQYVELDVPHRRPDARGTRREFSILSAPSDLPQLRIAYKNGDQKHPSSYKRALATAEPGAALAVTGTWGDFVLPRGDAPILMVAAGIGVTPFVSQLRHLAATGQQRDVVLVYVASESAELAFRSELADTGVRAVVFTRDEPAELPASWTWARGVRLDAAGLERVVPDLPSRHAFISGPPRLIADLAPALQRARSLTTDAFAGY